jgi:hypothetical protein
MKFQFSLATHSKNISGHDGNHRNHIAHDHCYNRCRLEVRIPAYVLQFYIQPNFKISCMIFLFHKQL